MASSYQWYVICAINILLLLCQGTCLVRPHSARESFTSGILIAWRMCCGDADRTSWRDLLSPEIQGGWEHFFPVDTVARGSRNHTLAVSRPEFSCALLQVNTLGWWYRVIFLPFFSFSVNMFWLCCLVLVFFTKQMVLQPWSRGWSTLCRFGVHPGCVQEHGKLLPVHRRDLLVGKVTLLVREVTWKCCRSPF